MMRLRWVPRWHRIEKDDESTWPPLRTSVIVCDTTIWDGALVAGGLQFLYLTTQEERDSALDIDMGEDAPLRWTHWREVKRGVDFLGE